MNRYVAFLRAINVGGHVVKMADLKRWFEALGFSNVDTFIASGNVVFDARSKSPATLETTIAKHLFDRLGYPVATFIRTVPELQAIAGRAPFPASDLSVEGSRLYIAFLAAAPAPAAREKLLSAATKLESFHVQGREAYWLSRARFSDSEFSGARLEKTLGLAATLRNVTTVRKMADKYGAGHRP